MTAAATSLVPSPPQSRTEHGIGASSAAAAIGASEYRRPIDAWLEATGKAAGFAGNEKTRWGQVLEPVIRAHYIERHHVAVHVPPLSLFHRYLDFVRATPDGIVLDANERWQYVAPQVKNVGLRQAPNWEDGNIPTDYLIQGVVEMAVTELPRIDFAVLIGGQEYREVSLERDLDLEAEVLEKLAEFWRLVETGTQPPVDGSTAYRSWLLKQARKRTTIDSTPITELHLQRWKDAAVAMKVAKLAEAKAKNAVIAEMVGLGANKLVSLDLGAITIGDKPKRNVAWKDVANELRPVCTAMERIAHELEVLRADVQTTDVPIVERLAHLHALAISVDTGFDAVVAKNTALGDPSVNRPRAWTKGVGTEADETEED